MLDVVNFIFFAFGWLLQLISLALLIWAIMGWLVAFDILSLRNRFVASAYFFLDSIARPLLYPIQRIIPPLGGVDVSPIVAILIIQLMQGTLIPLAKAAAFSAFAGA